MSFLLKPDYEIVKQRFDAFWECEIYDRPMVDISFVKDRAVSLPVKKYKSYREQWLDVDHRAEMMAASLENRIFMGESLPVAMPNMGPEIFSAWCGCSYMFGETTTWSEPCIKDWEKDIDRAVFDQSHPLFAATLKLTNRLLELGKGRFIVGLTDFHPGGDHIAALRDPQNLAIDMIENPDKVKYLLQRSYPEYFKAYDIFYELLKNNGMPATSWLPAIHDGRYYIPSNDFSCMISSEMFDEMFLPGIIRECEFLDRSIYHLDGPGALRHLDSLLEIKRLNAVQWVFGAGNEGYNRWIPVYQKIQKAGKGLLLYISLEELPLVFDTLRPRGVWFAGISGINDKETADRVIKAVSAWSI
jgi:hypothetical protein